MHLANWYIITGFLLLVLVVCGNRIKRLPFTVAILYLIIGVIFGRVGLIEIDPILQAELLERLSEVAVIVSLFSTALKLRRPLTWREWKAPLVLATASMVISVALLAAACHYFFSFDWGLAILLAAILAPTDPVLASDVQVKHAHDKDQVRFSLTGEAGMNDGTAFPFVMLGLGILGYHHLSYDQVGFTGLKWVVLDVVWPSIGGLAIGFFIGKYVGTFILYLRARFREAIGLDDFLTLGLIALAYGVSLALHTYGFLAVFAAGIAIRSVERVRSGGARLKTMVIAGNAESKATDVKHGPNFMAESVLKFSEHVERFAEFGLVLLVGVMLSQTALPPHAIIIFLLLSIIIRPIAVCVIHWFEKVTRHQFKLIAWFGVKGIGSMFYLFYAINHGLPPAVSQELFQIVLWVTVFSIFAHGTSVTQSMEAYENAQAEEKIS